MLRRFRYPLRSRVLVLLSLLVVILTILGGMVWRNLDRLERIHGYVSYSHQVETIALNLQALLTDSLSGQVGDTEQRLQTLQTQLIDLNHQDESLSPRTPGRVDTVAAQLTTLSGLAIDQDQGRIALVSALGAMGQIMDDETEQRAQALEQFRAGTLAELDLALAVLAVILILAGWFLRTRILLPLAALRQLLVRLAEEDFRPIATHHIDPLLKPVFTSYNDMVARLAELEEAKRHHAEALRAEVRSATHALLEQQRSLARAERLAAVGEVAAELAHELRNPLAGIQIACTNLRRDLSDAEQAERVDLIVGELKRMAGLLNKLLEPSRHTPAQPQVFDAARLVRELTTLLRYQIAEQVQIRVDAPDGLSVCLPESGLRQTLLNLLLNAAEALGETAGTVNVCLTPVATDLHLSVTDDGPGFSASLLEHGIRAFHTTRPDGTGLGLTVVQRYVREQGGRIKLNNGLPHGASIQLEFPGVVLDSP